MDDVDRSTPEAVFRAAQDAIAGGDMAKAFACFDRSDVRRFAGNSVRALATSDPEFDQICEREGFDAGALQRLHDVIDRMTASALLLSSDPSRYDSSAHQQMTKEYEAAIKEGLASVDDLARLAAGLEERMHARMGGGSVSSALFAGEALTDVVTDGTKVWATRVAGGAEIDDIGFVRQGGGWKIRLFARRPQH